MPAPGPDPLVVLRVALELKLLNRPQVEDCAKAFNAEGAKRPIAEILIEKGYIAPEAVRRVMSVAEERAGPPAGEFLKIAATLKILDGAKVQEAVTLLQATRRGDASEILVSNGFLTAEQAEKVRQTWKAARAPAAAPPPEPAPAVLIQVAIAEGLLTKAQAIQCISLVKKSGGKKPLSRILVEQGLLDETQVGGIVKLAREGKKTSRKGKEEASAAARASTALRRRSAMESVRARQVEAPEGEAKPSGMGRRLLAAALAGLVVLGGGGAAGYFFWWKPNHTPKPPTPPVVDNGGPEQPSPERVMDQYTEEIGTLNGELAQANTLDDLDRLAGQFRALRDRLDAETRLSERQARRAADKLFKLEREINTARQNKLDDLDAAHNAFTRQAQRLETSGALRELLTLLAEHNEEHGEVATGCRAKIEDWTREINEIIDPFEGLVALEERALAGPLGDAEIAEARTYVDDERTALARKAEFALVRHSVHALGPAMREAIEARRQLARERVAAAEAGTPPEITPGSGSIFEALVLPTCLDDLVEPLRGRVAEAMGRLPEEVGIVDKLANAFDRLKNMPGEWLRRWAESAAVARSMEEVAPAYEGLAPFHYWLAVAYQEGEQYLDALPQAQRAVELEPDYPEAYVLLGRVLIDLNRFDEAETAFDRGLELAGDQSHVYFFRALVKNYTWPRDTEGARALLDRGCVLNPAGVEAANLLKLLLDGPVEQEWRNQQVFERESDHYYVRSNVSQEMADLCANTLEWHREVYRRILAEEPRTRVKPNVWIFKTDQEFFTYSGRTGSGAGPGVAGYYQPLYRDFQFHEQESDPEWKKTLGVLVHEGFHQYARELIPNIPRWINESLAELSQGAVVDRETGEVLQMAQVSPLLKQWRLPELKKYFDDRHEADITLDTHWLENGNWDQFHWYVTGWSLMDFCWNADPAQYEAGRSPRDLLDAYIAQLRQGKPIREAFYGAFPGGRRSFGWLVGRWKTYVHDVLIPQAPEETPPQPEQPEQPEPPEQPDEGSGN